VTRSIVSKQVLRRTLRAERDGLALDIRRLAEHSALSLLGPLQPWQAATVVAAYMPIGSEFDPALLVQAARQRGVSIVYPRVDNEYLHFHSWRHGEPCERAIGGVAQPLESSPKVSVEQIDVFLTPLLACGDNGIRLGYGGGFYDRLFEHARGFKLGVGFKMQRISHWETEAHDEPLDGFVSGHGLETFSRR
jgi:5-formyltetrahydrofolate cyclo-ligase